MVILYNDRQLAEIRALYTNKTVGSVLSVDKTYNLGRFYVTVTVYRNLALQRNGTQTTPSFIGLLFSTATQTLRPAVCFLDICLHVCRVVVGSNEEQAIRKAAAHCFPGATLVACTRHLRENFYRNAEKVSLHVTEFSHILIPKIAS